MTAGIRETARTSMTPQDMAARAAEGPELAPDPCTSGKVDVGLHACGGRVNSL